ncbi:MAG: TRAP transporter small permease, partial [Aequoribacter sp.]
MQALTQWLDRGFRVLLVGLMAGMVTAVCWQVISRYALNDPAAWTEEMARFLLMWIGLLGACYAYREGQHLGV